MVTKNYDKYMIEDVKYINVRYFLIKLQGKSYIIDFSNPKDIRNYFPGFFPDVNRSWKIYEVTGKENQYDIKPLPLYLKQNSGWSVLVIYILYLVNIGLFPKSLNIWDLTYDQRIAQNWEMVVLLIFCGAAVIFGLLYSRKTKINLTESYKILVPVDKEELTAKKRSFSIFIGLPIFIIILLTISISSSSYSQLFMFGVFPIYSLLFNRFGSFLDIRTNKYQIKE
ncbi:hypothetical protein AALA52_03495 [Lactococcus ileimucosae]|uniref:DUF443 family protein n=1 Tax=Lactococcus ileimucosae TaxID=2941329 RepID=A0ABV4D179_9LACT